MVVQEGQHSKSIANSLARYARYAPNRRFTCVNVVYIVVHHCLVWFLCIACASLTSNLKCTVVMYSEFQVACQGCIGKCLDTQKPCCGGQQ